MALNEKAAMVICAAFMVGVPWALHRFAAPVEVPSPLVTAALGTAVAETARPAVALPGRAIDPRSAWVRGFQRQNALDTQVELNRNTLDALALLPPEEGVPGGARLAALPPLVYEPAVVAAADPAGSELLAAEDEPVVLASAVLGDGDSVDAVLPIEPARYRVARGDTLMRIARREWNSDDPRLVALLVESNPSVRDRKNRILVGEELIVPDLATAQRVLQGALPSAVAVLARAEPTKAEVAAALAGSKTADQRWYTIQRKDTLASIARRFLKDGRRWREIVALNRMLDPHKIVPGMRIKLPPVMRLAQG